MALDNIGMALMLHWDAEGRETSVSVRSQTIQWLTCCLLASLCPNRLAPCPRLSLARTSELLSIAFVGCTMVLTFKLADDVVSTIRNVLMARGFVEFVDGLHTPHSCNFQWKTTRYADTEAAGTEAEQAAGRSRDVQTRQRINHFQKTSQWYIQPRRRLSKNRWARGSIRGAPI